MIFAKIQDIEGYLPPEVITNEQLEKEHPEWNVHELHKKVGIHSRRICPINQTALDMAERAAKSLLSRNPEFSKNVDFLVYCTQSPDHFLPSGACILQSRLNLPIKLGAFDFNLGCSGYVYGLAIAKSLITSFMAKNILLLTGDTYTRYIHPADRTCRLVFGDAATATLITAVENEQIGLGHFLFGTDGKGATNLIVPAGALRLPISNTTSEPMTYSDGFVRSQNNIFMDGQEIFSFALLRVPQIVSELLKISGLTVEEVDWFVYHQANKFMIDHLMKKSHIPEEKMARYYEQVGNTVSSSIPIAMREYIDKLKIRPGHRLVLVGFGVGYSWAACELVF
jgi:3-oxoacyl-[acyl-carrier-protein] synthase III